MFCSTLTCLRRGRKGGRKKEGRKGSSKSIAIVLTIWACIMILTEISKHIHSWIESLSVFPGQLMAFAHLVTFPCLRLGCVSSHDWVASEDMY